MAGKSQARRIVGRFPAARWLRQRGVSYFRDPVSLPDAAAVQRRHIPALDAIRGLAIGLVLLRHAWPSVFGAGGFVGVELFFVLSGYLITSILLHEFESGRVSYRRFYINRILRLVPALTLMVLFVLLVVAVFDPLSDRTFLLSGGVRGLTYTDDIPRLPLHPLNELTHLWTLAIEEQFYIIWPLLLIAFASRGARRLRRMTWAVLALSLVALFATVAYGHYAKNNVVGIYTSPTIWAVTLVLGCALAIGVVRLRITPRSVAPLLLALLGLAFLPEAKSHVWTYLLVLPVIAVLSLCLIGNAISNEPIGVLNNRVLRYLGKISYAAYLWDYPLALWFPGALSIPLALAAASVSFWLVEQPFLRLKRRGPSPPVAPADRDRARATLPPAAVAPSVVHLQEPKPLQTVSREIPPTTIPILPRPL
jgi:peptidoglycan/LPS O-acetylase OafA/YrhL